MVKPSGRSPPDAPIILTNDTNNSSTKNNLNGNECPGKGATMAKYPFVSTPDDIKRILNEFFASCGTTFAGTSGGGSNSSLRSATFSADEHEKTTPHINEDAMASIVAPIESVDAAATANVSSDVPNSGEPATGATPSKSRLRLQSVGSPAATQQELQMPLQPLSSIPSPHKPLPNSVPTSPGDVATEIGSGGAQFRSSYYTSPTRPSANASQLLHNSNNNSDATNTSESKSSLVSSLHPGEQSLVALGGRTPREAAVDENWPSSSSASMPAAAFDGIPLKDECHAPTPLNMTSDAQPQLRSSVVHAAADAQSTSSGRNVGGPDLSSCSYSMQQIMQWLPVHRSSTDDSAAGGMKAAIGRLSCPPLSEPFEGIGGSSADRQALLAYHGTLCDIAMKIEALRDVLLGSAWWASTRGVPALPLAPPPVPPASQSQGQRKEGDSRQPMRHHTVPPASILRGRPPSAEPLGDISASANAASPASFGPSFSGVSMRSKNMSVDSTGRCSDAITEGRVRTVSMKSLHRVLTRRIASGTYRMSDNSSSARLQPMALADVPLSSDEEDNDMPFLLGEEQSRGSYGRSVSVARGERSTSSMSCAFGRSVADSDSVSHYTEIMPPPTTTSAEKTVDDVGVKMLNQYVMLGTIGEGACGKVKAALNAETNATVAIKIVRRADRRKLEALRQEVSIMKLLRHKNVVALHEVIDDPGAAKLYLVMQHIDCGSVGRLRGDGTCERLPVERVLSIVRQAAAGLEYLHNHGVVHRDVKPDNILMDSGGRVYLSDFGVSDLLRRTSDSDGSDSVSSDGAVPQLHRGTVLFMAPELLRGASKQERPVTPAIDVWALGVTALTLMMGCVPFVTQQEIEFATSSSVASVVEAALGTGVCSPEATAQARKAAAILCAMLSPDANQRLSVRSIRSQLKSL